MTDTTNEQQRDKKILTAIVKEMAESMTGAQSTKHWAHDALWFDSRLLPRGASSRR